MSIVSRSTQQYSGFDPRTIPGCSLWLDAADSYSAGVWIDKSENLNNATLISGSVTNTTVNGRNALAMNAYMTFRSPTIFLGATDTSVFIVLQPTANVQSGHPLYNGNTQMMNWFTFSDNIVYETIGFTDNSRFTLSYPTNTMIVYEIVSTGSGSTVYRNGTSWTNVSRGTGYLSQSYSIGRSGYNFQGTLCEMIVYRNAVTTYQRQQIEGYLGNKWGLRTNLPTSHPYRSLAPAMRPFVPTDLEGCALWLDAADGSSLGFSSGSNVNLWRDKSGNGVSVTQATSSNQPTYANNTLTFSGNQALNTNLSSYVLQQTVFCVCSTSATDTAQRGILGMNGSSAGGYSFYIGTNIVGSLIQRVHTWGGSPGTNGAVFTRNQVYLYGATVNSSTGSCVLYSNGSQSGSGSVASLVAGQNLNYQIGAGTGTIGEPLQGTISEMILFNSILTTAQRQQVEGYLAAKWGLSTALPPAIQAVPSIFDPRTISGCSLWFDGLDPNGTGSLPSAGSTLSIWTDKSGNNRNTSILAGTPTVIGTGGVLFNGSSSFRGSWSHSLNTLTYFVVGSQSNNASGNENRFLSFGTSGQYDYDNVGRLVALQRSGTAATLKYYRNMTSFSSVNITYDTPFLTSIVFDGTNTDIRLNGTSGGTSASTGNFSFSEYGLGVGAGGITGGNLFGRLFEVIVYSNALTTAQRQQIEGYLYAKWNIPITRHPYYRIQSLPTTPLFTPASLSGLQLWLDAADTSTIGLSGSGSNVSQWNDKSGNGRNVTQATLASQPSLTNGYINFTGSQFMANSVSTNFGDSGTLFLVASGNTSATVRCPLNIRSGTKLQVGFYLFVNTSAYSYNSVTNHNFNGSGIQSLSIYTNTRSSPSLPLFSSNGSVATSYDGRDPNSYTFTPEIRIGNVDGSYPFIGNIAEIIYYNVFLTTAQRQAVEGYLAWKWGIQNNLPLNFNRTIASPLAISGCALWLDAADVNGNGTTPTNGTVISTWVNKTGGTNATVVRNSPTFSSSLSGIVLANSPFNAGNAVVNSASYSMFLVARATSTDGHLLGPWKNQYGSFGHFQCANPMIKANITTGTTYAQPITVAQALGTTGPRIFGLSITSGASSTAIASVDGVKSSFTIASANYAGQDQNFGIGALYENGTAGTGPNCTIHEVIVYKAGLTSDQMSQVEAYLQNKWNVAVPTAHPYKNFRP